jgi:peroxiredoxin
MAQTLSLMTKLGQRMPLFKLLDTVDFQSKKSSELIGKKGTLVFFICNHCPFVHHVIEEIVRIANDYRIQGIGFIAISSNDVSKYPEDRPEKMEEFARKNKFEFPYLYDESQEVAKSFEATCTPDFFMYDADGFLVYRGQLDDSRPSNGVALSGYDLRVSIECILSNKPITIIQKPSIGCNIKWKNHN